MVVKKKIETTPYVAPKIIETETFVHYGDRVRMDRCAIQPDGTYLWNIYVLEPTNGRHPIHGRDTTEESVWVPRGQGTEEQARNLCRQISGIKGE